MPGKNKYYAILDILEERDRQDEKWGTQAVHSVCEWMTIIGEEHGEACQEALRYNFDAPENKEKHFENMRAELIQVAAACVAAIENIEKQHGVEI